MARLSKNFLIVFLFFAILLFPFYYANAFIDDLARLVSNYLIANIIRLVLDVSTKALDVATTILNWVLSEDFIKWDYTGTSTENPNTLVQTGWTIMRDLVNMFFVVALAFIGLATALKIREYEAQKTLAKLVIIILLVNFTPVICGLIIDASNIFTFFFVEKLSGAELLRARYAAQTSILAGLLKGWFDWSAYRSSVVQGFLMAGANVISALILLVFALLFAARYIVLWISVILSPLAFFSYVFPGLPVVGGFWRKWWDTFLQWCLIGVLAAFFLYLGNHILLLAPNMISASPPTESLEDASSWAQFLQAVVPFSIGVGFLWVGLMQSLSGAALGVKYVFSAARLAQGAALGASAAVVSRVAARGKRFIREKAPPAVKETLAKLATAKPPGWLETSLAEQERGWKGWFTRAPKAVIRAPLTPVVAGLRRIGETALPETELEEIEKAKKDAEQFKTPERLLGYIRDRQARGTRAERIAALQYSHNKGWSGLLEKKGLTKDEVVKIGREAFAVGPGAAFDTMRAFPELADAMSKLASPAVKKGLGISPDKVKEWAMENKEKLGLAGTPEEIEGQVARHMDKFISAKLTADLLPKEIEKLNLDYISKEAAHAFWSGREISTAARAFGREFVDEFMNQAQVRGFEWYEKNNPSALRYMRTAAAQELGFARPIEIGEVVTPPAPGATPQEKRRFIEPEIARNETIVSALERIPERDRTREEKTSLRGHQERLEILRKQKEDLEEGAPPTPPGAPSGRPGVGPRRPPRGRAGVDAPHTRGRSGVGGRSLPGGKPGSSEGQPPRGGRGTGGLPSAPPPPAAPLAPTQISGDLSTLNDEALKSEFETTAIRREELLRLPPQDFLRYEKEFKELEERGEELVKEAEKRKGAWAAQPATTAATRFQEKRFMDIEQLRSSLKTKGVRFFNWDYGQGLSKQGPSLSYDYAFFGNRVKKPNQQLYKAYVHLDYDALPDAVDIVADHLKSGDFEAKWLVNPKEVDATKTDPHIVIYSDEIESLRKALEAIANDPRYQELEKSTRYPELTGLRPGTGVFKVGDESSPSISWNIGFSEEAKGQRTVLLADVDDKRPPLKPGGGKRP